MKNFEELNIDFKNQVVLLDADGTLVPDDGSLIISRTVLDKISELKQHNTVFLCINSYDKIRKNKLEEISGLPILNKKYRKPNRKIVSVLERSGPHHYVVIGDKFLTDGLFAKNIGGEFIKVKRKISGQESLVIKLINLGDDLAWHTAKILKLI